MRVHVCGGVGGQGVGKAVCFWALFPHRCPRPGPPTRGHALGSQMHRHLHRPGVEAISSPHPTPTPMLRGWRGGEDPRPAALWAGLGLWEPGTPQHIEHSAREAAMAGTGGEERMGLRTNECVRRPEWAVGCGCAAERPCPQGTRSGALRRAVS